MKKIVVFIAAILLSVSLQSFSQTIPLGLLENIDDNLRRQQLLGNDTSMNSFMIRPINISNRSNFLLDSGAGVSVDDFRKKIVSFSKDLYSVYLLPVTWRQQFNGHHPYGWNDGSMIPSKGYQTLVSAGIYAKIGPLSIQFRPEYVYAENKDFRQLYEAGNGADFAVKYASFANKIDNPERFGNSIYSKVSWGQSNIRLTFDPVSVGISNENLWWGPGVRNSLLMSNNASGFKHVVLNTSRPINTPIGSFEVQFVGGKLENSNVNSDDPLSVPQPNDWRYLSGMVATYQPKWVPNLFLGFDRTFIVYRNQMGNSFGDYFPLFSSIEKAPLTGGPNDEDTRQRDQYASFYARWVMPESKSEIYFQFGRNDHPYDLRDAFVEPENSRAYIIGFRKLLALRSNDEYIQLGLEFTQMEGAKTGAIRAQPSWYSHHQVRGGYTNLGQVLGSGIGPGSNLQSFDISWVKGLKRVGILLERLVHNNDLFYSGVNGITEHWVDLSIAGKFDWTYKNFILNTQLNYIKSYNYQYTRIEGKGFWDWDKQDVNNLQLKVGLMYRW